MATYQIDKLIIERFNEIMNMEGIEDRSAAEWEEQIIWAQEDGDLIQIAALAAAQFELEK